MAVLDYAAKRAAVNKNITLIVQSYGIIAGL